MAVTADDHDRAIRGSLELADDRRRSRPAVRRSPGAALGSRLARDVPAPGDLPAFDNSQMDGYALRASDVADADRRPVTLPAGPTIAAGSTPPPIDPGVAAPIMTGAPIPDGADAVVPIERTQPGDFDASEVTFTSSAAIGQHVRRRGEDIVAGDVLLPAGAVLTPAAIGVLSSAGVVDVAVEPAMRVAVVSTGDEIASGQVRDANGAALLASFAELGMEAERFTVPDSPESLTALLNELDHDAVVTIGGISAGAYEVVKQVLGSTDGAWFGHVPIQPGGPQGRAVWNGMPVLCMPGNPVSTLVSFELFIRPTLASIAGREPRPSGEGPLAESVTSIPGKLQIRRGTVDSQGRIRLVGGPGSHLLASYAVATHLIFLPAEAETLPEGATVKWWRIAPT